MKLFQTTWFFKPGATASVAARAWWQLSGTLLRPFPSSVGATARLMTNTTCVSPSLLMQAVSAASTRPHPPQGTPCADTCRHQPAFRISFSKKAYRLSKWLEDCSSFATIFLLQPLLAFHLTPFPCTVVLLASLDSLLGHG